MSWKNHLKEKLVDAARRLADSLPTTTRYASWGLMVMADAAPQAPLLKVAEELSKAASGLAPAATVVGGLLFAAGALLRFTPGVSADWRQMAMKMMEGGAVVLAIVGLGGYILGGANWLGRTIAGNAGTQAPDQYINPWKWGSSG